MCGQDKIVKMVPYDEDWVTLTPIKEVWGHSSFDAVARALSESARSGFRATVIHAYSNPPVSAALSASPGWWAALLMLQSAGVPRPRVWSEAASLLGTLATEISFDIVLAFCVTSVWRLSRWLVQRGP